MNPDEWPHQFTKDGPPRQGVNGNLWIDMICVHCHTQYVQGRDGQPTGPCPARNTKRELKRVKR